MISFYFATASRQVTAGSPAANGSANRLIYSHIAPYRLGLFLANADGTNEHALMPANGLDYNASYSSDGKWIVFTSERQGTADIFRVHPDGSGLERLTDSPAYDDQAAISPDGQTVAFVSSRDGGTANIWLLDLRSHSYRRLTTTGTARGSFRPSWSPDGQWIAFSSDRDTKTSRWDAGWEIVQSIAVYIVHPDGTGLRRLTDLGGVVGSPLWSADGKSLLCYKSSLYDTYPGRFSTIEGIADSRAGTATSQIITIDVSSGAQKALTSGPGLKTSPYYVKGGDIAYIFKDKTERYIALTSGRKLEKINPLEAAWSPDGKTIVYQKALAMPAPFLRRIHSIDPQFDTYGLGGVFPAYSPSGDEIVMSGGSVDKTGRSSNEKGEATDGQLWAMNPDGTNKRVLFDAPHKMAFFAAWSPDGKSIAFGMGDFFEEGKGNFEGGKPKPSQIALINADGSNLRLLTNSEDVNSGFPSWSPDGKRILYRVDGVGGKGLRILNVADGKTTVLTTAYDNFPDWSPKGDLIEFTRFADNSFNIWTIKPDGTGARQLTNTDGNDAHAVWSPDERWIIFSSSRMGFKDEELLYNTIEHEAGNPVGPQPYGELFAMHADGTGIRQVTDNQWEDATAAMPPVAATSSQNTPTKSRAAGN